jgi:exonuclease SbcC
VRLESLSLRGILRFTDQITLDFRDLPPGLVAVVGPNGAGKTTLMESPLACLYRTFPSRAREAFDYATRADAFIETTFELEGRGLYRARLNLDGPHRKAEATLAQILPDGRAVLLNDGKVSTYDAEIAKLLPRLEDLLASVFAAQNKVGSFSGLDKKGRRQLFASLLGLDHYEVMAERARQASARVTQEIERVTARRDALARDAGQDVENAIDAEAQRLQVDLGTVELRREELSRLIADAERALATLEADLVAHAAAINRRDVAEADVLAKTAAIQNLITAMARADREAADERGRINVALTKALASLQAEARDVRAVDHEKVRITKARDVIVTDAQERIAANEELLRDAADIRAAVATVELCDTQLAEDAARQASLQRQIDDAVEAHRHRQQARLPLAEQAADLRRAQEERALLGEVPCGGAGDFAACQFLTNARAAQERIPALVEASRALLVLDAEIEAGDALYQRLKSDLTVTVQESRGIAQTKSVAKALADKLPHLQQAELKIAEHNRRITEALQQANDAMAAATAREEERQARLAREMENRQVEHDGALVVLDTRVAEQHDRDFAQRNRLEEERQSAVLRRDEARQEAITTKGAAERAAVEQAKLTTYRAEWDQTTGRLATVEARVESLESKRTALLNRQREIDWLDARIGALRGDLVEWSVLAKAMGRDGLPTIEIDQAGPTVSAYANDLLQACFGGRFTLELVTQAPKTTKGKDGSTHKEVFDANIYDQQRAGECVNSKTSPAASASSWRRSSARRSRCSSTSGTSSRCGRSGATKPRARSIRRTPGATSPCSAGCSRSAASTTSVRSSHTGRCPDWRTRRSASTPAPTRSPCRRSPTSWWRCERARPRLARKAGARRPQGREAQGGARPRAHAAASLRDRVAP